MKYLLLLVICCVNLAVASVYYSKLEPIESYKIKASINGKVIFSNEKIEGKKAHNTLIIQLDSSLDNIELKKTKDKLNYINELIKIEQKNYDNMKKVSSKSAFEKDSQKMKIINLKMTKDDTIIKIATLENSIKNKKLIEKNNYIYNINVKKGDYVSPGMLLYETKDLSKGRLVIFVPIDDIEQIKKKDIYIDDKKSNVQITKIYDVADSEHISSYKAEINIPKVKKFSKLVKIEFK